MWWCQKISELSTRLMFHIRFNNSFKHLATYLCIILLVLFSSSKCFSVSTCSLLGFSRLHVHFALCISIFKSPPYTWQLLNTKVLSAAFIYISMVSLIVCKIRMPLFFKFKNIYHIKLLQNVSHFAQINIPHNLKPNRLVELFKHIYTVCICLWREYRSQ